MLVIVVGYLVGSLPVASWTARRHGVDDLRDVGDHNPGYWNAKEQLGTRAALPVFVGDVLKGALPASLALLVAPEGEWWWPYVATGAAMVGHSFPVFSGFRGGRSVLTFVGGGFVCAPLPAALALGVMLVVLAVTRVFTWSVRIAVAAFPVIQLLLEGPYRTAATGVLMTFIGLRFLVHTNDPATSDVSGA